MSIYRINGTELKYRPRWVSYVVNNGEMRPKMESISAETIGLGTKHVSFKKEYVEYTLTWPVTTEDLKVQLAALPLNKTIELQDDVDNISKNIQILKKVILPSRTTSIGMIYNTTITFRLIE